MLRNHGPPEQLGILLDGFSVNVEISVNQEVSGNVREGWNAILPNYITVHIKNIIEILTYNLMRM